MNSAAGATSLTRQQKQNNLPLLQLNKAAPRQPTDLNTIKKTAAAAHSH